MEGKLSELITEFVQQISTITDNQTLEDFDIDYCKKLEKSDDAFIKSRITKCCKEIKATKRFEYDKHIKTAYEAYSEAITYYDLKQLCTIENIPESNVVATPDFKVSFNDNDIYI